MKWHINALLALAALAMILPALQGPASGTTTSRGPLSNMTVWDDTNDALGENIPFFPSQQVGFYANFTGGTEAPIAAANCTVWFNLTGEWEGGNQMQHNPSTGLFNYNRTFPSAGTFRFNVSCNASGLGFGTLNASDGFVINSTGCNHYLDACKTSGWVAGRVYCLNSSITASLSNENLSCFLIGSDNVTLDMRKYNLTGNGTGIGIYATTNANYTTIMNGSVSNLSAGIALEYNERNSVSHVFISNNTFGVLVWASKNNTISKVNASYNSNSSITLVGSYDNNLSYINVQHSIVGIYLLVSANNTLSSINTSYNSYSGALIEVSAYNTLRDIESSYNMHGITLSYGYANNIMSARAVNNSANCTLFYNSQNNVFSDSRFLCEMGETMDVYLAGPSFNNTFLNTTYNISRENVEAGSQLFRSWHYRAYVNDTLGASVSGANVSAYNSTGARVAELNANSSGWTPAGALAEYSNNGGTRSYYSNYTISARGYQHPASARAYNVSFSLNNFKDVFTLEIDTAAPSVSTASPSGTQSLPVWFNATTNESADWCGYSLNGSANITMTAMNSTQFYAYNSTLPDGQYVVNFSCNDTSGNMNASAAGAYFSLSAPPVIAIISPVNMAYNFTSVTLNLSLNSPAINCTYSMDGAANATMTGNANMTGWIANAAGLPTGSHTATFYCNDTDGYGFNSTAFSINLPPYWQNSSTNGSSSTAPGSDVYMKITLADDTGAGQHVFYWFNSSGWSNETLGSWINATQITMIKKAYVSAGQTFMWYWWFNDSSGNTNQTPYFSFTPSGNPGDGDNGDDGDDGDDGDGGPGGPLCSANAKRCLGDILQLCDNGTAWINNETCQHGCNATALMCDVPFFELSCTPGSRLCTGGNLFTCGNDTVWLETVCPNGCDSVTLQCVPVPVPPCTEGQTRCANSTLQQCVNSTWLVLEDCKYGCGSNGACDRSAPAGDAALLIVLPVAIIGAICGFGYYYFFMLKKPLPSFLNGLGLGKIANAKPSTVAKDSGWSEVEKKWSKEIQAEDRETQTGWEDLEKKWTDTQLPEPGESWNEELFSKKPASPTAQKKQAGPAPPVPPAPAPSPAPTLKPPAPPAPQPAASQSKGLAWEDLQKKHKRKWF